MGNYYKNKLESHEVEISKDIQRHLKMAYKRLEKKANPKRQRQSHFNSALLTLVCLSFSQKGVLLKMEAIAKWTVLSV